MKKIQQFKQVAAAAVLALGCTSAAQAQNWYVGANVGTYAHYRVSSAFGDTAKVGEFTLGVKVGF
jgi:hypothetical protein